MNDSKTNKTKFSLNEVEKKFKENLKETSIHNNEKETIGKKLLMKITENKLKNFSPIVFDRALTFTKFFLSERGSLDLNDPLWDLKIAENFINEFIEFYNFFDKTKTEFNGDYLEDFKSFLNGDYLSKTEKYEEKLDKESYRKTKWFKGINDALNQSPDDEKFWDDDEYYKGYQKGTDILRSLIKESKILFPVEKPTNKFVERQKELAEIINKLISKKKTLEDELLEKLYTAEKQERKM